MSKLYNEYLKYKRMDSSKVYLFKSGFFYIALEQDALCLSNIFGFKIINLNSTVIKCGFPVSHIAKYSKRLTYYHINFNVVDEFSKVTTSKNYIDNINISNFIEKFTKIDLDYLSIANAYNLLFELKNIVSEIKNKPTNE